MLLVLDNSDSPSIVEQLPQGPSLVYNTVTCKRFSGSRASTAKYLSTLAVPCGYYTLDT